MIARTETKYILITATDDPLSEQEIVWRARKYGWRDAGCHYIVERNGMVSDQRQHGLVAVSGRPHNHVSVVVVLSGTAPHTPEQLGALELLVLNLAVLYPNAAVVGHSELPGANTTAPGFDVSAWWTGLKAAEAL